MREKDKTFNKPLLIAKKHNHKNLKLIKTSDTCAAFKIALFIKEGDNPENDIPVKAIYFYNPADKVRISPVWFSLKDDRDAIKYNSINLRIIKDIYENSIEQIDHTDSRV